MVIKNPKILFLVTSLDIGGIERYLQRLVVFFAPRGWRIDIICRNGQPGELAKDIQHAGAKVIPLKMGYFRPDHWVRLKKIMKSEGYDAVCDFSGDFSGIPLWMAQQAGVPRRVAFYRGSVHHFQTTPFRMLYWRCVHLLTCRYATSLLSNSNAALDFFHPGWRTKKKGRRFQVIYNGIPVFKPDASFDPIDFRKKLGIPPYAKIIGHIGRFNKAKNHDTILQVAKKMCSRRKDIFFLLCGKGVDESLASKIQNLKLEQRVVTLGARGDIPQILEILDAFYFPSFHEGQPNALLEAIFAKIPFVASQIPSILESIPKEFHGCLVHPKDISGAVEKLNHILESPETFKKSSEALFIWAQKTYALERCFGQLAAHLSF